MRRTLLALVIVLLAVGESVSSASAATDPPTGQSSQTVEAVKQFRALKYGMFIHFGMSTFTGHEIDPGNAPSKIYAPTNLDVDQWVRVAHDAGMKYAVLTSKHVAGHCLWDSKVPFHGKEFDYDVATSGNTTDVVGAFVAACMKYHVMPGLYWCLLDGHNNPTPLKRQWTAARLPDDFYRLALDQTAELIHRYPQVAYYWLDIPRAASAEQRRAIYDHIQKLRPGTVVLYNFHLISSTHAWPTDVLNTERHPAKPGSVKLQQTWDGKTYELAYEHCDTLCKNWFWVPRDAPRPTDALYKLYRQVTDNGGDLLLDVPPDKTGIIPASSIDALMKLKQRIDAGAAR